MKLYFKSSNNKRRFLCNCSSKTEVLDEINKFLKDHNFKSYYTRIWKENDEIWFDVGSWSEFFVAKDEDGEWGEI